MVKMVNFMLCLFDYNLQINIFKYKRNLLIKIYVAILFQRKNNFPEEGFRDISIWASLANEFQISWRIS